MLHLLLFTSQSANARRIEAALKVIQLSLLLVLFLIAIQTEVTGINFQSARHSNPPVFPRSFPGFLVHSPGLPVFVKISRFMEQLES